MKRSLYINKSKNRKAQLTLTFNWIYVMIAGAVILLFFIGIVVKQKSVSQTQLEGDVVEILESILIGSTVSEQTKNFIDTTGLRDFTLEFVCELDPGGGFRDIFSYYGIKGRSAQIETPIEVIFAPNTIETTELIVWSMPFDIPFKVMDFLFVTSRDTKYYVIGTSDPAFRQELQNATAGINIEFVTSLDQIEDSENHHTRIIDLGGVAVEHNSPVPAALQDLDDEKVSAVVFPSPMSVVYYSKNEDSFDVEHTSPIEIVSTFPKERDAAKFGAIFAGSATSYGCNMMKAFERTAILSDMYVRSKESIYSYYEDQEKGFLQKPGATATQRSSCMSLYDTDNSLNLFSAAAKSCVNDGASCLQLRDHAGGIGTLNEELFGCIKIY